MVKGSVYGSNPFSSFCICTIHLHSPLHIFSKLCLMCSPFCFCHCSHPDWFTFYLSLPPLYLGFCALICSSVTHQPCSCLMMTLLAFFNLLVSRFVIIHFQPVTSASHIHKHVCNKNY